ncbi:MAG TPA: hypothetical protein DEQ43_06155, partial [Nocardioides bacterium]|nr:hypothetical protein [Nocardioides sp.]
MMIGKRLRAVGTGVLATALVLTVTETMSSPPAHADDPITVITSPPLSVGSTADPLTVTVGNPVNGTSPVVVDNPGGTAPTAQECVPLQATSESFCLGASGDALYPNGTVYPPVQITNAPTAPGGLPGDQMDWIIDEAYASTADAHGVQNDSMMLAYARPEIRAYVEMRLRNIIDKKLYGEPMTDQEEAAFEALESYYKAKQVRAATTALDEYNRWTTAPCEYVPPAPPAGSGMPVVPNPVVGTAKCSAANRVQLFALTNGTPPAETFEKWAAYRDPTNLVTHSGDARVRYMIGKTQAGILAIGAVGAAAAAGAGIGIGVAATAFVAQQALLVAAEDATFTLLLSSSAAAAGPAIIFAIALIILAVAIWQMVEDAKPGDQIRARAAAAAGDTDPLGVRGRIADYAGLSFEDGEDPPSGDPAVVHTDAFRDGLDAQVAEWMMFDEGGDPIMDPATGYSVTSSAADDLHFSDDNGDALPYVVLAAPDGALDRDGNTVDGYRVLFSRNWLMVSERSARTGQWGPYRPQLTLTYLDQDGQIAQLSLMRHHEGDDPAELQFSVTRPSAPEMYTLADHWTYTALDGTDQTVGLLPFDPVLLPVNVVPSIQGILIADNLVKLDANLSTPGQSLAGTYTWTIDRLDDSGAVVETITAAGASVTRRLLEPGRYRATTTFHYNGPPALTRTGAVEFTMVQPAPEVMSATVRDDRVLNGSLFLDLRLLQSTRTDTFTVGVDWADDGRGHTISKTYTVQCQDAGGDVPSCDTGPMILPTEAPTNANWSESPTFRIPDDQNFLPQVDVTITNSYGNVITRSFPILGDHRPSYATNTPYVAMPAGTFSRQDVVEVFPSPLLTESQDLTILPYVQQIAAQLP